MRSLPVIRFSPDKEDLLRQIDEVHNAIIEFYRETPDDLLESPASPDGWSILKNMKHVASTNRYMAAWIRLPLFILKLRGCPSKPDITVEQLRETNRPNIKNYGRYEQHGKPDDALKLKILAEISASAEKLKIAVRRRTEEELTSLSGMFGGMNLRMFVHFVLKHNVHHTNVARSRLVS